MHQKDAWRIHVAAADTGAVDVADIGADAVAAGMKSGVGEESGGGLAGAGKNADIEVGRRGTELKDLTRPGRYWNATGCYCCCAGKGCCCWSLGGGWTCSFHSLVKGRMYSGECK